MTRCACNSRRWAPVIGTARSRRTMLLGSSTNMACEQQRGFSSCHAGPCSDGAAVNASTFAGVRIGSIPGRPNAGGNASSGTQGATDKVGWKDRMSPLKKHEGRRGARAPLGDGSLVHPLSANGMEATEWLRVIRARPRINGDRCTTGSQKQLRRSAFCWLLVRDMC